MKNKIRAKDYELAKKVLLVCLMAAKMIAQEDLSAFLILCYIFYRQILGQYSGIARIEHLFCNKEIYFSIREYI